MSSGAGNPEVEYLKKLVSQVSFCISCAGMDWLSGRSHHRDSKIKDCADFGRQRSGTETRATIDKADTGERW